MSCMEPLVSIIIPVYGVEKYIAKCLESVIAQTYKNLEAIVVNDGTKDKSAEIAKEYAKKDSRIKVFDFENGGLSVARNRGVSLASGEYVTFLDSDDWIDSDCCEYCIKEMLQNKADILKFGVREVCIENKKEKLFTLPNKIISNPAEIYFENFLYVIVCNAFYRRELALKVKFPANVVHEDNYASGMYLALAKKLICVDRVFYNYRVNYNGISKSGVKRPLDKCIATKMLLDDVQKTGVKLDKYKWKFAVEVYHFIRGWNDKYRVKSIEKSFLKDILKYLDFRRRLSLLYLLKKKRVRIN